jgi:hypothetical protein
VVLTEPLLVGTDDTEKMAGSLGMSNPDTLM